MTDDVFYQIIIDTVHAYVDKASFTIASTMSYFECSGLSDLVGLKVKVLHSRRSIYFL